MYLILIYIFVIKNGNKNIGGYRAGFSVTHFFQKVF